MRRSIVNLVRLISTYNVGTVKFEDCIRWLDPAQIWLVPLIIVFNVSRFKPVFGRFETRLKFIKFGLRS